MRKAWVAWILAACLAAPAQADIFTVDMAQPITGRDHNALIQGDVYFGLNNRATPDPIDGAMQIRDGDLFLAYVPRSWVIDPRGDIIPTPVYLTSITLDGLAGTAFDLMTAYLPDDEHFVLDHDGIQTFTFDHYASPSFTGGITARGDLKVLGLSIEATVPEPATWAMIILGLGLGGGWIRYKKGRLPAAQV